MLLSESEVPFEGKHGLIEFLKAPILKILKDNDVSSVTSCFEGSGDSGAFEEMLFNFKGPVSENQENFLEKPIEIYLYSRSEYKDDKLVRMYEMKYVPLKEAIYELFYTALGVTTPGWEINEGSYGEATIEVDDGEVHLNVKVRVIEVEEHDYEF